MNQAQFRTVVTTKMPESAGRILVIGMDYGETLLFDVVNVLLHAQEKDKIDEVCSILEDHWEKNLQFQHPDIRGKVTKVVGGNPTQRMFLSICRDTLALEETVGR